MLTCLRGRSARSRSRPIACSSTAVSRSASRAIVDYLHALGISDCYASSYLCGGSRQPPRLRRRRPHAAQSGHRHRRGVLGVDRCAARARHGPRPGPRAEPHGHRQVGEPLVAGRARKRTELALRPLLRHRMASGQGRAGRQGADPDPRRSVRRGARATGAALEYRDGAFVDPLLRRDGCRSRPTPIRAVLDGRARRVARRSPGRDADELQSIITAAENLPPRTDRDPEAIADARARKRDRQAAARGARRDERGRARR